MGHVVDFIQLPNFAIFNIADSAVVSAVVIICLLTLRGISLDGSRHTKDTVATVERRMPLKAADMAAEPAPHAPALHRPGGLAGTRVDAGLARLMDISRSQAATLIAEGNVSSNGKAVGKVPQARRRAPCSTSWCRTAGTPWKSWRK